MERSIFFAGRSLQTPDGNTTGNAGTMSMPCALTDGQRVKRTRKRVRALSLLAVAVYILSSCIAEDMWDADATTGNGIDVRVSLQMPSSATRASSMPDAGENEVRTIDVLAFRADDTKASGWAFWYGAEGRLAAGADGDGNASKIFSVKLVKSPGQQTFAVLANARGELAALGQIAEGADKDELLARLVCSKSGKWNGGNDPEDNNPAGPFDAFPMWGEVKETITGSVTQITGIKMMRAVARIDVVLGEPVIDNNNFKLSEVYIYNSKNKGRVLPDAANLESMSKVGAATEPPGEINNDTPLRYAVPETSDTAFERAIYLFEAKGKNENQASQATCVVVGGTYGNDGRTTYYRLDFLKKEETGAYFRDILRNHHYRMNIVSVSGSGCDTPDEAFNSQNANMGANVTEWDDGGAEEVVFDGPYFLSVDKNAFEFSREAITGNTGDNVFNVTTDYPGGWRVEKIIDAETTAELAGASKWLSLAPASGNANVKTPVVITLEENNGSAPRSAKIILAVGRLNYTVTVTQRLAPVAVLKGESNCYMIKPGKTDPFLIPISQVGYAMGQSATPANGFLGPGWISDCTKLKAQVFWSDINVFGADDAVVKSVEYNGADNLNDGRILVVPGSGKGNAGIMLYEDNNNNSIYDLGERICWSWHIWNAGYYPYDAEGKPFAGGDGNRWMDRNLGATSNTWGDIKTAGLYYQWGRKDPYPGPKEWGKTEYDIYYPSIPNEAKFKEIKIEEPANLPNSVLNPLARYLGGSTGNAIDWFTTDTAYRNNNLWGGGVTTAFLHSDGKSVYDPCPEGYRVPKIEVDYPRYYLTGSSQLSSNGWWGSITNNGQYNGKYGGYYPAAGFMFPSGGGGIYNVSSRGNYWQATITQGKTEGQSLTFYIKTPDETELVTYYLITRSTGASVRCVAYK